MQQPFPGVPGILLEPGPGRAETEAVAPGVHVAEHLLPAVAWQEVGQEDLQVADAVLLVVAAAGVGVQVSAARLVHADVVAALVQRRVERGVGAYHETVADESRLGVTEPGTGNRLARGYPDQLDPVIFQEPLQTIGGRVVTARDLHGAQVYPTVAQHDFGESGGLRYSHCKMLQCILDTGGLQALITALWESGHQVLGPQVRDDAVVYARLREVAQLPAGIVDEQEGGRYRLHRTVIPEGVRPLFAHVVGPHSWKWFLHPPQEPLWRVEMDGQGLAIQPAEAKEARYAFFGVRACELAAMAIQDRVLKGGEHVDSAYLRRRQGLFTVAVNCTRAADTCFCVSMESGPAVKGDFDLQLTELTAGGEHRFLLEAGSEAGEKLLERLPGRAAEQAALDEKAALLAATARQMKRAMPAGAAELLADSLDSSHWESVAARCLHCGNCTSVCPTCFCTRTEERSALNGRSSERWRLQDSCFNEGFSYIHGGALRRSAAARYRQWITHKLLHWREQFGSAGCTGCGRCITWCPVGIDITEEVHRLAEAKA